MRIDDIEQEVYDFDWFAVDTNGHLVQFASCGGVLHESVATSREDLNELNAYFRALPIINATVHINPHLTRIVSDITDLSRYTESFIYYAQRGLFSFNKPEVTHPRLDNLYHLVAYPDRKISLTELPSAIVSLVSRKKLPFVVSGNSTLDANSME